MKTTKFLTLFMVLVMTASMLMTAAYAQSDLDYVKLRFVIYGDKPEGNIDDVWAAINEKLLKDINAEIEPIWLGSSDPLQKISLMYSANEDFDIAFSSGWFGYVDFANKNAFREYTVEEVEEYMPLLADDYTDSVLAQNSIDGKMYMFPALTTGYRSHVCWLIRGDLREKYGLDPIETKEDLVDYLTVIAENETTMNAMSSTYHLYFGMFYNETTYAISSKYDVYVDVNNDENPIAFSNYFSDNYTEFCREARVFYELGFWAADAIAEAGRADTAMPMFTSGRSATMLQNATTLNSVALQMETEHPEWKCELINLYMGVPLASNGSANGTTITRTCKNSERAMMAINLLVGDEAYHRLIAHGIEGVNYEINDEGKLVVLESYAAGCNWNWANAGLELISASNYTGYDAIDADLKANVITMPIIAFNFDTTAVETEIARVAAIESEFAYPLAYGMYEDVDAALAEFRAQLKAAGALEIVAEYQRQLDAYLAQ